jgi:hypothetical protein
MSRRTHRALSARSGYMRKPSNLIVWRAVWRSSQTSWTTLSESLCRPGVGVGADHETRELNESIVEAGERHLGNGVTVPRVRPRSRVGKDFDLVSRRAWDHQFSVRSDREPGGNCASRTWKQKISSSRCPKSRGRAAITLRTVTPPAPVLDSEGFRAAQTLYCGIRRGRGE